MTDGSGLYATSMIWMAKKIQEWDRQKPNNPDLTRFVGCIRNITDYVQELEVENRKMKRVIVGTKEWTEQS